MSSKTIQPADLEVIERTVGEVLSDGEHASSLRKLVALRGERSNRLRIVEELTNGLSSRAPARKQAAISALSALGFGEIDAQDALESGSYEAISNFLFATKALLPDPRLDTPAMAKALHELVTFESAHWQSRALSTCRSMAKDALGYLSSRSVQPLRLSGRRSRPSGLTRDKIAQYVWAKYIDNKTPPFEIDELEALAFFEDYYAKFPLKEDSECFYYGILLYERSFSAEEQRLDFLRETKRVLETYRRITGETEWDATEDRLADAEDMLEYEGEGGASYLATAASKLRRAAEKVLGTGPGEDWRLSLSADLSPAGKLRIELLDGYSVRVHGSATTCSFARHHRFAKLFQLTDVSEATPPSDTCHEILGSMTLQPGEGREAVPRDSADHLLRTLERLTAAQASRPAAGVDEGKPEPPANEATGAGGESQQEPAEPREASPGGLSEGSNPSQDAGETAHSAPLPGSQDEVSPTSQLLPPPFPELLSRDSFRDSLAVFRPVESSNSDFIQQARRVWRLQRLDRYCRVSPRVIRLLTDDSAADGTPEDHEAIAAAFGADLLLAFANGNEPARVHSLLADLADLQLPAVRFCVWASLLAERSADEARRELAAAVPALRKVGNESWYACLSQALAKVGERESEQELLDVVDVTHGDEAPWNSLLEWLEAIAPPIEECEQDGDNPLPASAKVEGNLPSEAQEAWLLRLRFGSTLAQFVSEIRGALSERAGALEVPRGLTSLSHLRGHIVELQERCEQWVAHLPSDSELSKDQGEALEALAEAQCLGPELLNGLLERDSSPGELQEIALLQPNLDLFERLPGWFWKDAPPANRLECLANPETRRVLKRAIKVVVDNDLSLEQVAPLPAPSSSETDPLAHLEDCGVALATRASFLEEVSAAQRPWVQAALDRSPGTVGDELRRSVERMDRFLALAPAAHPEAVAFLETLADQASREAAIDDWLRTIESLAQNFGEAFLADQSFSTLNKAKIAQAAATPVSRAQPTASASTGVRLSTANVLFGVPNARARLQFIRVPDENYGVLRAPVRLLSSAREAVDLALSYETKSRLREKWPRTWPGIGPTRLSVSAEDWQPASGTSTKYSWEYVFVLTVPVRDPEAARSAQLLLDITLRHQDGAQPPEESSLRLEGIGASSPLNLEWPNLVDVQWVEEHPTGPQREREELLDRLRKGESFAVIAPRRFGKSCLAEWLYGPGAQKLEHVLVLRRHTCPVDCRIDSPGRSKFWTRLSDLLVEEGLGPSVRLPELRPERGENALPGELDFDAARRAAHKRGYTSIVIVIDEAQRFFPAHGRGSIGAKLKDLLDTHWLPRPDAGLAGVQFAFFGLPTMSQALGGQLTGLLRPIMKSSFKEEELNTITHSVSQGLLQTTRRARELMARRLPNLLLLRDFLDRAARMLLRQGRGWLIESDVQALYGEILEEVAAGRLEGIGLYVADPLNQHEDLDAWRPIAAFPVAVALARNEKDGLDRRSARAQVLRFLNDWCLREGLQGRYTQARVEDHLERLQELQIYDEAEGFSSQLLADWLAGNHTDGRLRKVVREVLERGALELISIPAGATSVGKGGQANVLTFKQGEEQLAARLVPLPDEEARRRYQQSADALKRLFARDRDESTRYVFDLRKIGLCDGDDTQGAQLYRWVSGTSLDKREKSLAPELVADIGQKLAQAVRFIHRFGVLHRDLRPSNVILEDQTARPVLIDFGLARVGSEGLHTVVASPFAAPEVAGGAPEWTTAADIYGLGATLRALLKGEPTGALADVISQCTQTNAKARPDAEQTIELLAAVGRKLDLDALKREHKGRLSSLVAQDLQHHWFRDVYKKFEETFITVKLGFYADRLERLVRIADFVNQILERRPPRKELSLGSVKRWDAPPVGGVDLRTDEINLMHKLRLYTSHGGVRLASPAQIRRQFGPNKALIEMVIRGTEQVSRAIGLSGLPNLARELA